MSWLRRKNSGSTSVAPQPQPIPETPPAMPQIFRTYSATTNHHRYNNNGQRYPNNDDDEQHLFRTASNVYDFNSVSTTPTPVTDGEAAPDASEETLVTIGGAMVHLVDEDGSPLLAEGAFSVVRVEQEGNGIVAFVRVGEDLKWPLTREEPVVKLEKMHYFFAIRVPRGVDQMATETAGDPGDEVLSYGVTFAGAAGRGQEKVMRELDGVLEKYCNFSKPKLVTGDRQAVVPEAVVSGEGKQVTEGNQAEFWRTMAPNVDEYNSTLAKSMAKGTGSLIKGIFMVRDSTVTRLENGSVYFKGRVKPNSKPTTISPQTLRNLQRVQNMSIATERVAKNVLEGVVTTVGFFSGAMMRSKPGKKFFKLLPGEVALVSMDAFAKVFDALEKVGTDVMQSTKMYTQDVVSHRYGEDAGQVTETTMATAGHVFATAWTVSKVRRALNPSKFRPSKTGLLKAAAKAAVGGRSQP